jgi:hypothetical protein
MDVQDIRFFNPDYPSNPLGKGGYKPAFPIKGETPKGSGFCSIISESFDCFFLLHTASHRSIVLGGGKPHRLPTSFALRL